MRRTRGVHLLRAARGGDRLPHLRIREDIPQFVVSHHTHPFGIKRIGDGEGHFCLRFDEFDSHLFDESLVFLFFRLRAGASFFCLRARNFEFRFRLVCLQFRTDVLADVNIGDVN